MHAEAILPLANSWLILQIPFLYSVNHFLRLEFIRNRFDFLTIYFGDFFVQAI